jgi:hypothetical protein
VVLGYLLVHRGRPVRRDALIDALRTDGRGSPPGESALAPVLSRIRRAIGPEARIDGRGSLVLTLPEPVWVDVEAARDALGRARAAALRPAAGDPAATVRAAEEALALTGAEPRALDEALARLRRARRADHLRRAGRDRQDRAAGGAARADARRRGQARAREPA